jgi:amino acid permease
MLTVFLWACCCLAHFCFRTITLFQGPHENEIYVYSLVFQGICFAMFQFPLWLCGLAVVLWVESVFFSRNIRAKETPTS